MRLKSMLFENSKQKLNSNQTTQIMGTKTYYKNLEKHPGKSDFGQKHM